MSNSIITVERDNGDVIPFVTPDDFSWGMSDLDAEGSGRSRSTGTAFRDRVATKRKLGIGWGLLSAADTAKILTSVSDIFFDITYPDAMTGDLRRMRAYVGDRTAPKIKVKMQGDNMTWFWGDLSFNIVER